MKDEFRLIIAFSIAVVIMLFFGMLHQGQRPPATPEPPPPAVTETPRERPPVSGDRPAIKRVGLPTIEGEERTYEDKRHVVVFHTDGGGISRIGLKQFTRSDERYFPVFEGSGLFSSRLAEEHDGAVFQFEQYGSTATMSGILSDTFEVEKTFHIPADTHTFDISIAIRDIQGTAKKDEGYIVSAGILDIERIERKVKADREFTPPDIMIKTAGEVVKTNLLRISGDNFYRDTEWIALQQRYSLILIRAAHPAESFVSVDGNLMNIGFMYGGLGSSPESEHELSFSMYAGPSDYFVASREIEENIFGHGFFAYMGRFLFTALSYIHRVIPNWGWAIIFLTLVIKVVFYPLTRKSLRSMKAMQQLRPYLQDVQKKYKNNPQQMQKELMGLYKEYKINPFGGCIPMLMQFPIFIGFFIALRNSIFLRGASFGLWVNDLSMPDRIMQIGDFNLNLLPLIMAATSLWQQKLTPQEPSQKALTFMMPVMFLFLFYNFSSGLLLYWITMNMAGLVEQYFVHKKKK